MIVGLLAGTFDPPHKGHLEMAKVALWSNKVDKVAFLPCWKHAFGKQPTDFNHRVNMCKAMIASDTSQRMEVWPDERNIESQNSVAILEYLHAKYTDVDKFRLILGADNYWKMSRWKNPKRVCELAEPLWIDRPGYSRIPVESLVCNLGYASSKIRRELTLMDYEDEEERKIRLNKELDVGVKYYIFMNRLYKEKDNANLCKV